MPEIDSKSSNVSRYVGGGFVWAVSALGGLVVGRWVDEKLGSEPWLTLVGAFAGAAAGFWWLVRELVIVPARRGRERSKAKPGSEE